MPNRKMSILRKFKGARATFSRYLKPEWNNPATGDGRRALQMKPTPTDGLVSTEGGLHLIPGELILHESADVQREQIYSTDSESHFIGRIILTNFRLVFIPNESSINQRPQDRRDLPQRSRIVGNDDIVLNCIDVVYKVSAKKQKKKKLFVGSSLISKTRRLEIHCRDFRLHRFTFLETANSESVSMMVDYLLRCAFPTCEKDLFAFVHEPPIDITNESYDTYLPRYNTYEEWSGLLNSCNANGYRVTLCNTGFAYCDSLPERFVVPRTMSDKDVVNIVRHSVNNRCPVWTYSHTNGAAIIRAGCTLPGLTTDVYSEILSHISNSAAHTNDASRPRIQSQGPPVVIDLDIHMSSLLEVRAAHEALRQLCMPGSLKEFWTTDGMWYASLETSNWLNIVSRCLTVANQAGSYISNQSRSVVLKEETSCDWSALIASLMQLLLDERYRTAEGYQRLIDKDWAALGHRFTDRYCLDDVRTTEQCPLFLLFLDCTYQLLHQFPSSFQFTEIYLVSIWDSLSLGVFRNFLYNNVRSAIYPPLRQGHADLGGKGVYHKAKPAPLSLKSVWDWGEQFGEDQISLFYNPLYLLIHGDGPEELGVFHGSPNVNATAFSGASDNSANPAHFCNSANPANFASSHTAGNFNTNNSASISHSNSPVHIKFDQITVTDTTNSKSSKSNTDPAFSSRHDSKLLSNASMTASLNSGLAVDDADAGIRRRGNRCDISSGQTTPSSSQMSTSPLSQASRSILHDFGSPIVPERSPKAGFIKAEIFNREANITGASSTASGGKTSGYLEPKCGIASLRLWSLCYLRWLPPAEIFDGGDASQYLIQCISVEEILHLQHKISVLESLVAGRSHLRGGQARTRPRSILVFGSAAEGASLSHPSLSGSLLDTASVGDDIESTLNQSSESQTGRGAAQAKVITSSFPFPLDYSHGSEAKYYGSSYMDEFFKSSILYSEAGGTSQMGGNSSVGGACLDEGEVFDDEGGVEYKPGVGANVSGGGANGFPLY